MGWVNDLIEAVLKFFGLKGGSKPVPAPVVPSPQPIPSPSPAPTIPAPSPVPTVIKHDQAYFLNMIYDNFVFIPTGLNRFNVVSKEFEGFVSIHGGAVAAEQFRVQLVSKQKDEAIKLILKALDDAVTSDNLGITVNWIADDPIDAFRALTYSDPNWCKATLGKYKITEEEVKEFLKTLI